MPEVRPRTTSTSATAALAPHARGTAKRSLAVGLLLALTVALLPAQGATAQTTTDWDAANACPATVPASGFTDATGPHGRSIDCLAWFALTTGQTATSYGTNGNVRRDQTASFVVRTVERLVPSGFILPPRDVGAFRDVTGGPHRTNIETLAGFEPPVVAGYADGTYRPTNSITRAQFASIVTRTLDKLADQGLVDRLPAASSPFTDTRGSVHEGNIARLAAAGIVQGRTSTTYAPNAPVTRGQTASILARVLGGLVDEQVILQPRRFAGVVHEGTDAAPGELGPRIVGAQLTATGFTTVTATSDSQGRYAMWLQQPGEYTLELQASGFVQQQRTLLLPDEDTSTDLAMYRRASDASAAAARNTSVPMDIDASDVTITNGGEFWRVALAPRDARDADEILHRFPQGLVVVLGDAGAGDPYFSRHPGAGTSDRIGADSGVHTLYYRFGAVWERLEARFDANGTLVEVNGAAYSDPDAS
jgi:hypothetical protein